MELPIRSRGDQLLPSGELTDIRKRLLFVMLILVIYRALSHVLIPGINPAVLTSMATPDRATTCNAFS